MSQVEQVWPAPRQAPATAAETVYRKVIWRLMPYLLLACAVNAIDRINISFAKLRMAQDIGLTDAAFGLGAGIFYLGYILFEVPSNLLMQRIGARATLTRIMMLWGAVTVASAIVTTPNQLIVARFCLGIAEAGFFPGVILYLTYWFPAAMRGRTTAAFVMAGVVAGVVSGPLAGSIMTYFEGWLGLRSWQVLFVFEGLPAILLGVFGWFWLTDKPAQAAWLNDSEKEIISAALAAESGKSAVHGGFGEVLRDPRLYIAGLVCFCVYSDMNTASYWMPTLLRSLGLENLKTIGMVSSLPYLGALLGMYLLGRSSDQRQERRWHLALTLLTGAACFFLLGLAQGNLPLSVFLLCFGTAGSLCGISLFWTIPPALLSPARAAGGIAIISSIGNLAAALSQFMVGAIKSATGSLYLAFDVIAAVLVVGAVLLLIAIPARHLRERGHQQDQPS